MEKVQCVSFPRSGHHMLANSLWQYFTQEKWYSKWYGTNDDDESVRSYVNQNIIFRSLENIIFPFSNVINQSKDLKHEQRFVYCEHYSHCKQTPCSNKATTLQKNHDIGLSLTISDSQKYILQIRRPLPAIISWYKINLKYSKKLSYVEKLSTEDGWNQFFKSKIQFYEDFCEKWIFAPPPQKSLTLFYDNFVEQPNQNLSSVIDFLCDDNVEVNHEVIKKISSGIHPREQNYLNFPYYSDELIRLTSELDQKILFKFRGL